VLDPPALPIAEDAVPVPRFVPVLAEGSELAPAGADVLPLAVLALPRVVPPAVDEEPKLPVELPAAPVLGVDGVLGDIGVLTVLLLLVPALPKVFVQGVPGAEVPGVCPTATPARLASTVAAIAAVNFLVTGFMFETPEIVVERKPTACRPEGCGFAARVHGRPRISLSRVSRNRGRRRPQDRAGDGLTPALPQAHSTTCRLLLTAFLHAHAVRKRSRPPHVLEDESALRCLPGQGQAPAAACLD
jgi:hypothetical protein